LFLVIFLVLPTVHVQALQQLAAAVVQTSTGPSSSGKTTRVAIAWGLLRQPQTSLVTHGTWLLVTVERRILWPLISTMMVSMILQS
jgi:ABC-type molybdate transport system ATPase subunit